MTQNPKLGAILCLCLALGTLLPSGRAVAGIWGYRLPDPVLGASPLDSTFHSGVPQSWLMSRVGPGGQLGPPQRDAAVSYDPQTGQVRETYSEGGVEVRPPILASVGDYNDIVTKRTYKRLWRDHSKATRSVQRGGVKKPTGLFHVELPFQVPKQLRSIVGSGAPNIDVSGSETITLSGVSDWTVRPKGAGFDTERQRQSAFPSLEMKQDLQVNLTGSIGDKIKVDVDQSSNVQTNVGDNKVKLRYEGDDDDMIKSVDLGNTNLSLQGASIRQEGLFGVKTVAKLGNVDVVAIASKQEGKSETSRFTPSGEKRQVRISDLDYIKRQYFFISDHPMVWDRTSLKVYKDDAVTSNNSGLWPGLARLHPDSAVSATNPERAGIFDDLKPGDDYQLEFPYLVTGGATGLEIPVIKLRYPLGPNEIVAVTYVEKSGTSDVRIGNDVLSDVDPVLGKEVNQYLLKMIKPPIEDFTTNGERFDPNGPWFPALAYELRNYYDLTARNIAIETLDLKVRQRNSGLSVDPDAVNGKALVEALGLDTQGRTSAEGPDGKIDDRFIRADDGILFFPDLHPFDPDPNTTGCGPTNGGFLCLDDLSRNVLSTDTTLVNPNVYYTKNPNPGDQSRYYIDAQFKSSQQGYFIGRFNILENSEQVKVDGVLQQKGKDYFIDYDTGQVNFARAPGPEQVITVDYSFAPGIGQVQRTLLGFSTSYNPSADLSVTSSMLYESRGAQELNPKLGEEPARSMVGDLASVVTFRPSWMTQFANLLPGVATTAPSTLNLQGNVALSMPNPNTKGEAYVDDMEGNRESNTLALSRTTWMWSSIPVDAVQQPISLLLSDHARIEWYNARGVKERDLKPVLTNEEGGDNERAVLEMNVLDPTGTLPSTAWTGLTQSLSRNGEDFSRTRFIEVWVNDRVQDHSTTRAKLHIDFGRVSEDAFWQTDSLPNHRLDTEDRNGDTKLDFDEDTGLDGVPDISEPGYNDPASSDPKDPRGDDYFYTLSDSKNYSKINGTEGNSFGDPNARPDTEDLDLDTRLDEDNAYFEATIDLATDTTFVAVDVARDYAGNSNVKVDNGWRLFRIPLDSAAFQAFGRPSWDDVKHARLWLDGMAGPTNIQIGGIEMVGSRWLATPLPDSLRFRNVEFDVKVRNNKDDAAIYEAPFEVQKAVGGNAIRREQSLALSFTRLLNGDSVFSFKTFGDNGSGIGYTQYRNIRFYVHGDPGVEAQNVRVIARFGADTVNYYEYSLPVRSGWQDVRIPMEILSRLKESSTDRVKIDSLQSADIGARYTAVGNPSFTRVNRITFGITVFGGTAEAAGEVWIDELRLSDVRKDAGKMGNLAVQATFADVLSLNASYQKQDQDFFRVGSGVNRGSGLNHTALGFSSTLFLDRMIPQSGVQLPVRVSVQHSSDVPKYRTGSDVVLDAARSEIETRSSDNQSIDLAYSRTGARKGLTKWTIDAIKGNMAYSRSASVTPQSTDSSWLFTANGNYSIPIGGGKGIPLSKSFRVKYLPELVSLSAGWSASRRTSYARFIQGLSDSSALRSNTLTRDLSLGQRTTYTPINGMTTSFSIDSRRNMLFRQEGLFGFNMGTEVDHRQGIDLGWTPRRLLFLSPNINLAGAYHEDARPELRISQKDPPGLKNIENRATARVTNTFPLSRIAQRLQRPASARDSSGANPLTAPLRFVFSRLQDLQTSFSFERASSATRVVGNPGFSYKSGFTQKFDPSMLRASNSNVSRNRRFLTTANTTFKALSHVSIDVRADHQLTFTDAYLGARRAVALSWPDLNGRWLQLQEDLGLQNALSSLVLSSHYTLKREDQGPQGKPIETRARTTTWAPLLGWQASFKNGVRADVNSAVTKTSNLDERQGGVVRARKTENHDVRLTKTYLASKGIKFPWSKRRVKLPNDLNLNLTMGIQRDISYTDRPGYETLSDSDIQRLNVGSGTSYNFTPSITGGFDLGFRQTRDYKSNVTQRGITIAVNAQFRF